MAETTEDRLEYAIKLVVLMGQEILRYTPERKRIKGEIELQRHLRIICGEEPIAGRVPADG